MVLQPLALSKVLKGHVSNGIPEVLKTYLYKTALTITDQCCQKI
jgi:hypothetical protein